MRIKIIIPVYKAQLSSFELLSLKACLETLKEYMITLVTYRNLDITLYQSEFQNHNIPLSVEHFDKHYFDNVYCYNQLLLNRDFYLRFHDVDYILIYQLDAFVFKNDLIEWCKKDYDYIGAPWFKHYKTHESGEKLYKVGNGGVSLRKVSTFLNIFDQALPLSIFPFYLKNIRLKGLISMCTNTFKLFIMLLWTKHNTEYYLQNFTDNRINEDCFWTDGLSNTKLALKVPNVVTAAHFCIEKSPSYLYHLIGNKLPSFCHAYEKYEYNVFWQNFIPK